MLPLSLEKVQLLNVLLTSKITLLMLILLHYHFTDQTELRCMILTKLMIIQRLFRKKHILIVDRVNLLPKLVPMLLVGVTIVRCSYLVVNYAQTKTLASNVKLLNQEIGLPGKNSYLDVLKSAHLVTMSTNKMNVPLVTVVLNVLVQPILIVLAVTSSGDKMLMAMVMLLQTGKVSSNLLSIKSKLLVVNKFLSK